MNSKIKALRLVDYFSPRRIYTPPPILIISLIALILAVLFNPIKPASQTLDTQGIAEEIDFVSYTPSLQIHETGVIEVKIVLPDTFYHEKESPFLSLQFSESTAPLPFIMQEVTHKPGADDKQAGVKTGLLGQELYLESIILIGKFKVDSNFYFHDYHEFQVPLIVSYQLCDEQGTCFFPQEKEKILYITVKRPAEPEPAEPEPAEPEPAEPVESSGPELIEQEAAETVESSGPELIEQEAAEPVSDLPALSPMPLDSSLDKPAGTLYEIFLHIGLALLGGLLLNLMPCVLPVLSIRAINLVSQSRGSKKHIFLNSLFYASGIIITLLGLGFIIIILKLSGEMVGWGFQFQNPRFIMALLSIIFLFSLSLFNLFIITLPPIKMPFKTVSWKQTAKSTTDTEYKERTALPLKVLTGSFLNGVLAVILATPCSAPFLGAATGYAFSRSPLIIILLFLAIGIGFAAPFLLIGIKPNLIKGIPKPGPWVNIFKELMGFLLLATSLYLLSILRYQISSQAFIQVLFFLLILGFAAWLYGKIKGIIPLCLAVALIIVSALFLLDFEGDSSADIIINVSEDTPASVPPGWQEFSPEKANYYINQGEALFINFSAQWCAVCKVNEQRVLGTEEVMTLFAEHKVNLLYGDYTLPDPDIYNWITASGRAGVPVYLYYPPQEEVLTEQRAGQESTRQSVSPLLLPEILSIKHVKEALSGRN